MEDFVDVIGYEGLYKINQVGEIFAVRKQKKMKQQINRGYYSVCLSKDGKEKTCKIHRLVAIQFISNPNNLPEVDHIDRNKRNNSLENLRWVTSRTNSLNKENPPISGEHNITISRWNTFEVHFIIDKKTHSKSFKTMEEAKVYRDNFKESHQLV